MTKAPITQYGPDFPFACDDWIAYPSGLRKLPTEKLGARVAIIGAGSSGLIAGYELMRMGAHPIFY